MSTMIIKQEQDEEEEMRRVSIISQKEEERPNDDSSSAYIVLDKIQSDQIARYPQGCRVVVVQRDDDGGGVYFASVEAVAIHLPTRQNAYKLCSVQPSSSLRGGKSEHNLFVLEPNLLFAQETPVWAVIGATYRSAIVMSSSHHRANKSSYTVIDSDTLEMHSTEETLVCYRNGLSAPPVLDEEAILAANENAQNSVVVAKAPVTTTFERAEVSHATQPTAATEIANTTVCVTTQVSRDDDTMVNDEEGLIPENSKERTDFVESANVTPQESHDDGKPSEEGSTLESERYYEEPRREAQCNISPPRANKRAKVDVRQQTHQTCRHEEQVQRSMVIPLWADLREVRERALRERNRMRRFNDGFLGVNLSEGLMIGNGAPAVITLEGSPEKVDSCIDQFMILVCESTQPSYQLFMMYELAFANPELSCLDGDLAFVKIPRLNYRETQWVGIFDLPPHRRIADIVRVFVGKGGQAVKRLQGLTGCEFDVTKDHPKPHMGVRSPDLQAVAFGMMTAKKRVMAISTYDCP